jgi:hypothetical protein
MTSADMETDVEDKGTIQYRNMVAIFRMGDNIFGSLVFRDEGE